MLPLLRRSAAPYIGNVTSGLGTVALLTDPASPWRAYASLLGYNSSKAALNAVTLIYASTLAGDGFTVNGLSPGFCATDLNGHRGHDTAAQGGARIARQVTLAPPVPTGVLLTEDGTGTYPW
jgi:NAD(P)-dependent dehydrogenase (short-subunit alcohol dehydrogenase family)